MNKKRTIPNLLAVIFLMTIPYQAFGANGYLLHGSGAVNVSLGGAAAAGNSSDLLGSIHRNPANGTLFESDALAVSLGMLLPDASVKSSVDLLGLSGSSDSEVDFIPCFDFGMVFRNEDNPYAFYFGVISEAGLGLEIPQSTTNPIFFPQTGDPSNPLYGLFGGFGTVETQLEVVRIPIGISYDLDSKWSVGLSVAPSVERMRFTPAAFAAPDDANGDGIPSYPDKMDHSVVLGIGFQAGARYQATDKLNFGFSVTSPTWFEEFEWDTEDEMGNGRKVSFQMNRPLSIRIGTNYSFTPETLLLLDAAWINYSNTKGFDETGFTQDGALKGLGFDDVMVLAMGVQHNFQKLTVRAGYNYGTNPIDESITFYNVASPLHCQHHLTMGFSWPIFKNTVFDFGYAYAFESSQSGPWYTASGAVSGTEVETELSYHQVSMGVTAHF